MAISGSPPTPVRQRPGWGAPKIRERLRRLHPEVHTPAISTGHAILDRHGLVKRRRRRRHKPRGTALSSARRPNDLWYAEYKGEFMLADRRYCYPLTISDFASRYLIACDALSTTRETYAFSVFERAFKDFGLPKAIRTDNGVPFSSPHALFGLSRLSVWWLRLGIQIERIKPGHPQQNGRHERMHLTLKKEATKPAAANFLQQQGRFDDFLACYNEERPHQALQMRCPAELYAPSPRRVRALVLVGAFATYRNNAVIVDYWKSCVSRLSDPIAPSVAHEFQESTLARPIPPEFLELVVQESLKVPAHVWRAAFAGMLEDDFIGELAEVSIPTLCVWGDRDAFPQRADQERFLGSIQGSRLKVYEGAGHALHWEEPARFAADLTAFIADVNG